MSKLLACFAALCFTVHHSLLVMESSEKIGSFTLTNTTKGDLAKGIYPTKFYLNEQQAISVQVTQSFPPNITTNFFIEVKKATKKDSFDNQKQITYLEEDKKRLLLFMNSFLGTHETERYNLPVNYTIKKNSDPGTATIIECFKESITAMGVPPSKKFSCFSLELRLVATYSTAFNVSSPNTYDHRHKIALQHLNDTKKERTLTIDKKFKIASIFLEGYFLIVGSYLVESYNKMVKNKYRIDIYNAEPFASNQNAPSLDEKNSDVPYYLGISIEGEKSLSADEAENNDPLFKLITITDEYCILQNQITKTFIPILYKNIEGTVQITDLKVIYKNTLDDGPDNIDGSQKISDTKNPDQNDPKSSTANSKPQRDKDTKTWLRDGYVQIGSGTALLILLIAACNHKKLLPLFKKVCM